MVASAICDEAFCWPFMFLILPFVSILYLTPPQPTFLFPLTISLHLFFFSLISYSQTPLLIFLPCLLCLHLFSPPHSFSSPPWVKWLLFVWSQGLLSSGLGRVPQHQYYSTKTENIHSKTNTTSSIFSHLFLSNAVLSALGTRRIHFHIQERLCHQFKAWYRSLLEAARLVLFLHCFIVRLQHFCSYTQLTHISNI